RVTSCHISRRYPCRSTAICDRSEKRSPRGNLWVSDAFGIAAGRPIHGRRKTMPGSEPLLFLFVARCPLRTSLPSPDGKARHLALGFSDDARAVERHDIR